MQTVSIAVRDRYSSIPGSLRCAPGRVIWIIGGQTLAVMDGLGCKRALFQKTAVLISQATVGELAQPLCL
jgi:hypothetical protein